MSKRYLIGLDAGGGSGRCLLVDVDSGATTIATRPWSHLPAAEGEGWAYDLDLDAICRTLGEVCHEALARAGAPPGEILGIAATSMRHGTVVLDKKGNALLAVPNRDGRAASTAMELGAERGAEFAQRTGRFPAAIFTAVRLKWLADTAPELLAKAASVLSVSEWLTHVLCGKAACDASHAAETMLFDLQKGDWAWDLIKSLGLPKNIFPKIVPAGSRLGKLTSEAAELLGLKAGTPVAVGGGDTQCGLLGTGALAPGALGIIAGTTTPLQLVTEKPILNPKGRLWTGMHVLPGRYVLESNAGATGEGLEWIARVLYPATRRPVQTLDAEAMQSVPGSAGLVSTFGAQIFDGSNMSLPFGYLTVSHMVASNDPGRRRHVARSILEGLAYAVRANAEQLGQVSDLSEVAYYLTGGMSRSLAWPQMVCDVLDAPITVARLPEATALGAAMCAGVGGGVFKKLEEGSRALAGEPTVHQPNPEAAETYAEIYHDWTEFRTAHADADAIAGGMLMRGMTSAQPAAAARREPTFRPRMLITAQMDETALERFRRIGDVAYENYRETFNVLTGDDLVAAMQGRHVFVTEVDVVDADVLSKLPDLRLLASCRGNAVNIDVPACTAFGVPVLNTPGRNADAVADLTVAFMLMLARKLSPASQFLHDPQGEEGDLGRMGAAFTELQGIELWRKTVGLIGMGAIGRRVIQRLLPFGARLLVYDPYVTPQQAILAGAEWVPLDTLLAQSDFVSLHAPSNAETAGMLGAAQFARMKPGACLINTARAALTDETALAEALRSGHLGGAALDVFSVEPPGPQYPLLQLPNVIATPHVGGNTQEVAAHQGEIIADELERVMAGERPQYLLNPEVFDGFSWTRPRPVPSEETLARLRAGGGPAVSDLDAKRKPAPAQAPAEIPQAQPSAAAPAAEKGSQAAMLEKILHMFLAAFEKDAAMLEFAAGRTFTMQYTLSDADLEFHMVFENGAVRAGMGPLDGKPDLALKMKAEIFDGMMTGKVNATSAAMTGKMKFTGDTSKAMQMQRIQKDIMRIYTAAREEVGDPGDLRKIGAAPAAAAPAPAAAPPVAAAPAAAAVAPAPAASAAGGTQVAKLEEILRGFLTECEKDASMLSVASSTELAMHYLLTDTPLEFYMLFGGGKLKAGMGAPPEKADLTLKMKAAIFDQMMTGKISATGAAMSGKIKFSGDTRKAMSMQRVQKDIMRLYSEVRDRVGDPGDLSQLGAAPAAAAPAAAPAAGPAPQVVAAALAAPAVMRVGDERDELVDVIQELYEKDLITATGGNVSVRVGAREEEVWITPSAMFKGNLSPELMVRINMEGEALDDDAPSPSSERLVHTEIYKARPDLNAIIHSHAPWATLLALSGTPFLPVSTEAAFVGDIPCVPFIMPGTLELAQAVAKAIGEKGSVVLMQNHGLVVAGSSLRRAASTSEVVERYCELILRCLALGKQPPTLPDDIVKTLREMGAMMA